MTSSCPTTTRADQILESALASLGAPSAQRASERDVVRAFMESHAAGHSDALLPLHPSDTIICEQVFRYGRADIVIYHVDGSVSVVEAKDGSRGYSAVVAGIGQATLYAVQVAQAKGVARLVRRCLLWSSTQDLVLDAMIETACEEAGVISLAMPSAQVLRAVRLAAQAYVERVANGCTQES